VRATIAERVAKGAALLDEKIPGWDKDIDLARLDLASPCRCILGQLHYSEDASEAFDDYWVGLGRLNMNAFTSMAFGFAAFSYRQGEYDALGAEWSRVILARREAARS
jgi:hypothetical protein